VLESLRDGSRHQIRYNGTPSAHASPPLIEALGCGDHFAVPHVTKFCRCCSAFGRLSNTFHFEQDFGARTFCIGGCLHQKTFKKKYALHRPGIGQEKPIGPAKTRGASLPDGGCLTEDTGMVEKR